MKRILIGFVMLSMLLPAGLAQAADTQVNGRLYTSWMYDLSDNADGENAFSLDRTYVTVKSKLSEWTSLRITSDLRSADVDGKEVYNVIIKYGYIDWRPEFAKRALSIRLGLQPTPYIDFMNKLWGRRYLSKTVGDLNKFVTTSDLGASATVGLGPRGKAGSFTLGVFQGTSYSSLGEMNKQKDINAFLKLTPVGDNPDFKRSALTGQFYHGVQNEAIPDSVEASDWKRQIVSVGGMFAYRHILDLGGEVNFATMGEGPGMAETKMSGHSVFGTLYFDELVAEDSPLRTLNLFGRVDLFDPNTDVENDAETHIIVGVECVPVKGFKTSVNFRQTSPEDSALDSESGIHVNTLFKF